MDADPYLKYPPSVIAASAITLALHTFNLQAWVGVAGAVLQACISRCEECMQTLLCERFSFVELVQAFPLLLT